MESEKRRWLSYLFLTPIVVYSILGAAWAGLTAAGYDGWSFGFHADALFPFELVGLAASGFLYVKVKP